LFCAPSGKFLVMADKGESIDCGGHCHNIKPSMGDHDLTSSKYAISIGGLDAV
jgi:hypothetical protein